MLPGWHNAPRILLLAAPANPGEWRPARHEVPHRIAEQNLHLLPNLNIVIRHLLRRPRQRSNAIASRSD
jgi:hypothetical protein